MFTMKNKLTDLMDNDNEVILEIEADDIIVSD